MRGSRPEADPLEQNVLPCERTVGHAGKSPDACTQELDSGASGSPLPAGPCQGLLDGRQPLPGRRGHMLNDHLTGFRVE